MVYLAKVGSDAPADGLNCPSTADNAVTVRANSADNGGFRCSPRSDQTS